MEHRILFLTFIIFQVHVVGTELLFASVAMVRGSYCGGRGEGSQYPSMMAPHALPPSPCALHRAKSNHGPMNITCAGFLMDSAAVVR